MSDEALPHLFAYLQSARTSSAAHQQTDPWHIRTVLVLYSTHIGLGTDVPYEYSNRTSTVVADYALGWVGGDSPIS